MFELGGGTFGFGVKLMKQGFGIGFAFQGKWYSYDKSQDFMDGYWLAIGWLLDCYWMAISWLLDGY